MTKAQHRAQGTQAALQKHEQHQSKHIQNEVGFLGKCRKCNSELSSLHKLLQAFTDNAYATNRHVGFVSKSWASLIVMKLETLTHCLNFKQNSSLHYIP